MQFYHENIPTKSKPKVMEYFTIRGRSIIYTIVNAIRSYFPKSCLLTCEWKSKELLAWTIIMIDIICRMSETTLFKRMVKTWHCPKWTIHYINDYMYFHISFATKGSKMQHVRTYIQNSEFPTDSWHAPHT